MPDVIKRPVPICAYRFIVPIMLHSTTSSNITAQDDSGWLCCCIMFCNVRDFIFKRIALNEFA